MDPHLTDHSREGIALDDRPQCLARTSTSRNAWRDPLMGSVIGEILPLALGIAISPIPVIAAILMLLSPKAKAASVGFMLGWICGIVIALTIFILLASALPQDQSDQPQPVAGVIKILLGAVMILLALKQWRGRPHDDAEPPMPKWMSAIGSMTAGKGFGLGFLLSAVNPKNLLMAVAAGMIIGSAGLSAGSVITVVIVFTIIAASSVTVPVVAYLVAAQAMAGPLESLRGWLVRNNATVMAVLLLVIGVTVIGKGIGNL
jgi:threonine/homoserine/homoserine lactone efflux protein